MHATAVPIQPGDILDFRSNGGGGFGNPLERDVELVRRDVMNELISLEKARDVYGVVIRVGDPEKLEYSVDEEATRALREGLSRRPRKKGFGPWEVHPYGERLKIR
jgi:N-methylhydantoinase B